MRVHRQALKIASNSALSQPQIQDGFRYSGPKPINADAPIAGF
jgi:hypothetical protein